MTEIYEIKQRLVDRMGQLVNSERMDLDELDMLADIVKDLVETEKSCMEAEYYQSVTDAMGATGYMPGQEGGMGYGGRSGYQMGYGYGSGGSGGSGGGRGGGRSGYRDSRGRFARSPNMGYGGGGGGYGYDMGELRMALDSASPEEREKILQELRGLGV